MPADVLTAWGVVLQLDPTDVPEASQAADAWFAAGRDAYFDRCPRLATFLRTENATLRVTARQVGPFAGAAGPGRLWVGISVVEVRPSSFDVAVRIRLAGDGTDEPVNGRCTLVIERLATGERVPIPGEVRDEFIEIQLAARELG